MGDGKRELMDEMIVRLPALRGPLPGEDIPACLAGLPRLWPGLPPVDCVSRTEAEDCAPPQGPWFRPDNFPLTPQEALACVRDLQAMTEAALSGVPVRAWQSRQGAAMRAQTESAARRAFAAARGDEEAALAQAAQAEEQERLCRAQRLLLLCWLQEERLAEMAALSCRYAAGRARLDAAFSAGEGTPEWREMAAALPEALRPVTVGRQETASIEALLPPWERVLEAACHFLPGETVIVLEGAARTALLEREEAAPCGEDVRAGLGADDGLRLTGLHAPLWRLLRRPRPPRCCPHWEREFRLLTWENPA